MVAAPWKVSALGSDGRLNRAGGKIQLPLDDKCLKRVAEMMAIDTKGNGFATFEELTRSKVDLDQQAVGWLLFRSQHT